MSPRITVVVAVLTLVAAPAVAQAQTAKSDQPAAQALFNEARDLVKKGKFAEACPKLEESLRLDYGIGTEFNLADCNEHIGKTATAWSQFLSVAAAAKSKNQGQRESIARKRAAALEPQLPRLLVDVPHKGEGLEVTRDEIALGSAVWGTAVPVDPGSHRVVARAPGRKPWETVVEATPGHTTRVVVPGELPALVARAPAPVAPPPNPAPPTTPAVAPASASATTTTSYDFPEAIDESRGQTQRTLGWITTGVGLAGLGVAGGFGLASLSARNQSSDHCQGNLCDAEGVALRDRAYDHGNVATVTGIAGGALAATGLVLLLTAPSAEERRVGKASIPSATRVGLGPAGFIVRGTFQ